MLKKIAIGVAAVLIAVLAYAATKPNEFQVSRSALIHAPASRVQPLVNDFHAWGQWSPWEKLDPGMKRSFEGAPAGKGAAYGWQSEKVGSGHMEIQETTPEKISIKLDFTQPFEAHNIAEFGFEPRGDSTMVTWTMRGPANYFSKLMTVFMSMDSMIGKDFEAGLSNMRAVAEKT